MLPGMRTSTYIDTQQKKNQLSVSLDDFEILLGTIKGNGFNRKIFESMMIKRYNPSLNVQGKYFPLKSL